MSCGVTAPPTGFHRLSPKLLAPIRQLGDLGVVWLGTRSEIQAPEALTKQLALYLDTLSRNGSGGSVGSHPDVPSPLRSRKRRPVPPPAVRQVPQVSTGAMQTATTAAMRTSPASPRSCDAKSTLIWAISERRGLLWSAC